MHVTLVETLEPLDQNIPAGATLCLESTNGGTYTVACPFLTHGQPMSVPQSSVAHKHRSSWSLRDICLFIVYPLTRKDKSLFTDWLLPEALGNPFEGTYVSVPYDTSMEDLTLGLSDYCSELCIPSSSMYVWMDVFCDNQARMMQAKDNIGSARKQANASLLKTLLPAVKKFDETVLILDSWEKPTALTRAWCVYELWAGALGGRNLHIIFSQDARMKTADWLDSGKGLALLKAAEHMELSNLQCENDVDLGMLFDEMHKVRGGFSTIKRAVHARIKRWLMLNIESSVREVRTQSIDTNQDEAFAYMLANAGTFLRQIGEYHNAMNYFKICRQVYKRTRGTEDRNYGAACNSLASILRQLGQYDEALELFREDLAVVKIVHGERNAEVAYVLNNMANCFAEQGDFPESLRLSEEALEILRENLGEDHDAIANTLQNIAIMYSRQDEYEMALKHYREAILILRKLHGEDYPKISEILVKVAGVYLRQKDVEGAYGVLTKALDLRRQHFGERHSEVAKTLLMIAHIHEDCRDMVEAVDLAREASEIYNETLGPNDSASEKARRYLKHLTSTATKAATKANMRSYMKQNL